MNTTALCMVNTEGYKSIKIESAESRDWSSIAWVEDANGNKISNLGVTTTVNVTNYNNVFFNSSSMGFNWTFYVTYMS